MFKDTVSAALSYAEKGWYVFPVAGIENGVCTCHNKDKCDSPGKHPVIANWQEKATRDPEQIEKFFNKKTPVNIGIKTGKASGLFVLDVDIKGNGAATLEEKFGKMPNTLRAKSGSGGEHYYFRYPIGKECGGTVRRLGDGLDTRADGGLIVAPPSLHISGGSYEWDDWETPLADPPPEIIAHLENVNTKNNKPAGQELEIVEGERHDLLIAEAAALRGRGWAQESIEWALLGLGEKQCDPPMTGHADTEEIKGIAEWAGKKEPGRQSTEDVIAEMNARHAVMLHETGRNILTEYINEDGKLDIKFTNQSGLKQDYRNKPGIDIAVGKKMNRDAYWLNHSQRREYENIIFHPKKSDPRFYNLWRGWAIEPKEGECSLYINHILTVIASGDKERYNYIIGWMAHAIQRPDEKPGTALVLRGKQGTGKGQFVQHFGTLFGPHFLQVTQQRQLTGNFNAHQKDALLIFSDEAFWAGNKNTEGVLKAMVTEEQVLLEFKGKDAYQVKSYSRLIIASNNQWVVPAGPEERRFFTIDVSNAHIQDHAYFEKLNIQMRNGGWEALMYFLQNYNLKEFNIHNFPKTDALFEQKIARSSDIEKFWYERLCSGSQLPSGDEWYGTVATVDLQTAFKKRFPGSYQQDKPLQTALGQYLKDLYGDKLKKTTAMVSARDEYQNVASKKTKCYNFPPLTECRGMFAEKFGQTIEWDDHTGADDFFGTSVTKQMNTPGVVVEDAF